jgi:hypothetical protein
MHSQAAHCSPVSCGSKLTRRDSDDDRDHYDDYCYMGSRSLSAAAAARLSVTRTPDSEHGLDPSGTNGAASDLPGLGSGLTCINGHGPTRRRVRTRSESARRPNLKSSVQAAATIMIYIAASGPRRKPMP